MERPFRVPAGYATGVIALVLSAPFVLLYLPGGPSALVWPYEWLMVLLWSLLGMGLLPSRVAGANSSADTGARGRSADGETGVGAGDQSSTTSTSAISSEGTASSSVACSSSHDSGR